MGMRIQGRMMWMARIDRAGSRTTGGLNIVHVLTVYVFNSTLVYV
jgi:hypothetical protein